MGEEPGEVMPPGDTKGQIRRNIASQREELGRTVARLESKARRNADWRVQFQRNPLPMMGAAFVGGLLLSKLLS